MGDEANVVPKKGDKIQMETSKDKQKRYEEMQKAIIKLREERIAKHTARIQMLKKMNLEKYSDKSNLELNKINKILHSKPSMTPRTNMLNKTLPSVNSNKNTNTEMNHGKNTLETKKFHTPQTKAINKISLSQKTTRDVKKQYSMPQKPMASVMKSKLHSNASELRPLSVSFDIKSKIDVPKTDCSIGKKAFPSQHNLNKSIHSRLSSTNAKSRDVAAIGKSLNVSHLVKSKVTPTICQVNLPKEQHANISTNKSYNVQRKNSAIRPETKDKKGDGRLVNPCKSVEHKKSDFNAKAGMRRSLSTVHFKRMGPEEAKKCMRRTFSVGNMKHKEIEDELMKDFPYKNYHMPVESEKKKSVKFLTPLRKSNTPTLFLNTPKPSELKSRLNSWLQKRGKSLSSYHHLHCFGIHKRSDEINNLQVSDENKENKEVLEDETFDEYTTGKVKDNAAEWRRASYTIEDSPMVQTLDSPNEDSGVDKEHRIHTLTGVGALDDLHHLISEGYSWQQCAEWLDAIVKHCGEEITKTAIYWECRAALEDKRGDFSRAVECYNKAIMQGVQPAEVEESLDHLLQKFMELNLNPEKKSLQIPHPKFLDVKNVFKSTLIRFAIQQKNIAESNESSVNLINKYVATPVRRSSRLSHLPSSIKADKTTKNEAVLNERNLSEVNSQFGKPVSVSKTAGRKHLMQLCSTLQNVDGEIRNNMVFVPNKALNFNDV